MTSSYLVLYKTWPRRQSNTVKLSTSSQPWELELAGSIQVKGLLVRLNRITLRLPRIQPTLENLHTREVQSQGPPQKIPAGLHAIAGDRKSTRLNSSHQIISYAVFCLKKKKDHTTISPQSPESP